MPKTKKVKCKYEFDILGLGFGIRDEQGDFTRVWPFWISLKEVMERECYAKETKEG